MQGDLIVALAAAAGAVASIALCWRARRWRRAGDHPHCRRCDFDLVGRPDGSMRCPECGADLAAPRAIVVGERRPLRFAQAGAVGLALACLGVAIFFGRGVDWSAAYVARAPTRWLTPTLDGTGRFATLATAALRERLQADGVDDATRGEIARALWPAQATMRPRGRAGDQLSVRLELGRPPPPIPLLAARLPTVADELAKPFGVWARVEAVRVGDAPPHVIAQQWKRQFDVAPGIRGGGGGAMVELPADLAVGETFVEFTIAYRLLETPQMPTVVAGDGRHYERELQDEDPATAAWTRTLRLPVEVMAAGTDADVKLTVDPTLRDAMRAAIGFRAARSVRPTTAAATRPANVVRLTRAGADSVQIDASPSFARAPFPVAADVFLRDPAGGGPDVPIGRFVHVPGKRSSYANDFSVAGRRGLRAWRSPTATIVLRPSRDAARSDPSLVEIWGEEIVVDDVVVERDASLKEAR